MASKNQAKIDLEYSDETFIFDVKLFSTCSRTFSISPTICHVITAPSRIGQPPYPRGGGFLLRGGIDNAVVYAMIIILVLMMLLMLLYRY